MHCQLPWPDAEFWYGLLGQQLHSCCKIKGGEYRLPSLNATPEFLFRIYFVQADGLWENFARR